LKKGDKINSAYVRVYVDPLYQDANLNLHFELAENSTPFTNTPYDITSRQRTVVSTPWVQNSVGSGYTNTPDISAPLQELLNTFTPSHLTLIVRPNNNSVSKLTTHTVDNSTPRPATIVIDYTPAAPIGDDPRARWTLTSRLNELPALSGRRRFSLDASINWINYQDEKGFWQGIDTTLVPQVNGDFLMEKAPYAVLYKTNGERIVYPDRNNRSRYIRFPVSKFLSDKSFIRQGNNLICNKTGYSIKHSPSPSGPRLLSEIWDLASYPSEMQFDVDLVGVSETELLSWLPLGIQDSSRQDLTSRKMVASLKNGVLIFQYDLTGLVFPVFLDPTLDLQVGATTDDTYEQESTGTSNINGAVIWYDSSTLNTQRYYAGMRWNNGDISQGDTIDVAYISVYVTSTAYDDPNQNIHFEKTASPATFDGSSGEVTARTRTTASASWIDTGVGSGWVNSPSIVTPFQELVDAYDPTALMVITRPNTNVRKYFESRSYNYSGNVHGPKLHVEYTIGGGVSIPVIIHHFKQHGIL